MSDRRISRGSVALVVAAVAVVLGVRLCSSAVAEHAVEQVRAAAPDSATLRLVDSVEHARERREALRLRRDSIKREAARHKNSRRPVERDYLDEPVSL